MQDFKYFGIFLVAYTIQVKGKWLDSFVGWEFACSLCIFKVHSLPIYDHLQLLATVFVVQSIVQRTTPKTFKTLVQFERMTKRLLDPLIGDHWATKWV